jgi:hypothetical protein
MLLFAHHLELHHLPVLTAVFAAGCWTGWNAVSRFFDRRTTRTA